MRSNTTRMALAVGAIAALVVLFAVLSGGSDNKKTSTGATAKPSTSTAAPRPQLQVLTVRGGKPAGGIKKLAYTKGGRILLRIDSDVADEVHVHGYDFKKNVPAGGSVTFDFPATIEGVFRIELEKRGEQIAQLTVSPA